MMYANIACFYESTMIDCSEEQLISLAYAMELWFYNGGIPNYEPNYCGGKWPKFSSSTNIIGSLMC